MHLFIYLFINSRLFGIDYLDNGYLYQDHPTSLGWGGNSLTLHQTENWGKFYVEKNGMT